MIQINSHFLYQHQVCVPSVELDRRAYHSEEYNPGKTTGTNILNVILKKGNTLLL